MRLPLVYIVFSLWMPGGSLAQGQSSKVATLISANPQGGSETKNNDLTTVMSMKASEGIQNAEATVFGSSGTSLSGQFGGLRGISNPDEILEEEREEGSNDGRVMKRKKSESDSGSKKRKGKSGSKTKSKGQSSSGSKTKSKSESDSGSKESKGKSKSGSKTKSKSDPLDLGVHEVVITPETKSVLVPPHRDVTFTCEGCDFVNKRYKKMRKFRNLGVRTIKAKEEKKKKGRKGSEFKVKLVIKYERKEIRQLKPAEWARMTNAFWDFKEGNIDEDGYTFPNYDHAVAYHAEATLNATHGDQAHNNAGFITWHTNFLLQLERSLQYYDPTVALHYWDWTLDDGEPVLFVEEYFGEFADSPWCFGECSDTFLDDISATFETDWCNGDCPEWLLENYDGTCPCAPADSFPGGNPIPNGPFKGWKVGMAKDLTKWDEWILDPDGFIRGYYNSAYMTQPELARYSPESPVLRGCAGDQDELDFCIGQETFANFWACLQFGPTLDKSKRTGGCLHTGPHVLTGGGVVMVNGVVNPARDLAMGDGATQDCSPNDPLFFLHHSNLERAYEIWKYKYGNDLATESDPCGGYDEDEDVQQTGHKLHDVQMPVTHTFGTPGGETSYTICKNSYHGKAEYVYDDLVHDLFSLLEDQ